LKTVHDVTSRVPWLVGLWYVIRLPRCLHNTTELADGALHGTYYWAHVIVHDSQDAVGNLPVPGTYPHDPYCNCGYDLLALREPTQTFIIFYVAPV
jgi:hypothetical protein